MPYIRDKAFVLRIEPFREYDLRVSLYGERYGKLIAVARGARRQGAKQAGHLEPLNCVEVMIAPGKAFDKLAVARAVDVRPRLRERLYVIAICAGLSNTLDALTRPGTPDPGIFKLMAELQDSLLAFREAPSPERGRLLLSVAHDRLLKELGYAIEFDREPVADFTPERLKIIRFLRLSSLENILKLTIETKLMNDVSRILMQQLEQTHLQREPHGPVTVTALLD